MLLAHTCTHIYPISHAASPCPFHAISISDADNWHITKLLGHGCIYTPSSYHLRVARPLDYSCCMYFRMYYIPLSMGTPTQTQNALLDTGSGVLHMPCDVSIPNVSVSGVSSTTSTAGFSSLVWGPQHAR